MLEEEIIDTCSKPKAKYPEFRIQQKDLDKHGFTRGCPGCSARLRGLQRQPHYEPCRKRFEEIKKKEAES